MVAEILGMVLAQAGDEAWLPTMLRASINTHHDRGGIALEHYRITLGILIAVLREAAGPAWEPAFESAWQAGCDRLFALIERYY